MRRAAAGCAADGESLEGRPVHGLPARLPHLAELRACPYGSTKASLFRGLRFCYTPRHERHRRGTRLGPPDRARNGRLRAGAPAWSESAAREAEYEREPLSPLPPCAGGPAEGIQ